MGAALGAVASQLSSLGQAVRLIRAATGALTLAWGVLLVVQGLLPAAFVYLIRLLVDSLVAAIGTGGSWERVWPTLSLGGLLMLVMVLTELAQGAGKWVRTAQAELVQDHISAAIHEKAAALDLAFYESPAYHDRLAQVRDDLGTRPLALLEGVGGLTQNAITLLAMATLLMPYGVWLPLVLVGSTVPGLWVAFRFNRRSHRWWEETTPVRRRAQYYEMLLTQSAPAAELRLFDLGTHFRAAYQALRGRLRAERLALIREQSVAQLAAGALAVLTAGAVMAWMVWRAFQGWVTLGDLTLFYQAFQRGQGLLRALLQNVGNVHTNTLFVRNLFEFLALSPRVADPPAPVPAPPTVRQGIQFRQVTFRYPGSEHAVLRDFDLTIPAGSVVAIVGANGAGKTTLVKLLCRFYDPEAGSITLDGHDLRALSVRDLRRLMTVLFQFPVPYHTSAAENIALGDLTAAPGAAEIEAAARHAGAHRFLAALPRGYETLLGKWFAGGTQLSGGEWQRLALARAFLRRAPLMILDEPTTFLDSWAEVDWFDRFRALARGRTALLITHRVTIARRADVIHVMDHGRIVESGRHDELLARGGLYARSWTAQTQDGPGSAETPAGPDEYQRLRHVNDGGARV